jgi:hypothetical protein
MALGCARPVVAKAKITVKFYKRKNQMLHSIDEIRQNSSTSSPDRKEAGKIRFDAQQAKLLHKFSQEISAIGGPQVGGAKLLVAWAANEMKLSLSIEQHDLVKMYADGFMSMLVFEGMERFTNATPPRDLPPISTLESHPAIHYLASRNQILLKIVDHLAFAYDIDNDGKIVRLVGNFKGGGLEKIRSEPEKIELSSHSGLSLGPHTEAPYWCSVKAENGHSPAPSTLILSALWNPLMEPTSVIPMLPVLEKIGALDTLALSSRNFNFTRSDSFVGGKGEDGQGVSIVDFSDSFSFSIRFNSYRFSVDEDAPFFVKNAYERFCAAIDEAIPNQYALTQESAILINNCRALHCRDIVKDNRRLLVRVFGFSKYSEPVVISDDPLLVKG